MEIWKPIIGFNGDYEISSHGNVRSCDRFVLGKNGKTRHLKGKPLKIQSYPNGYKYIILRNEGQYKSLIIHRLVAIHFISNPPAPHYQVNHIDLSIDNNRVENLEWVSPSENIQHALKAGRFHASSNNRRIKKLSIDQVREIRALKNSGLTQQQIANKFNISRAYVSELWSHSKWRHI